MHASQNDTFTRVQNTTESVQPVSDLDHCRVRCFANSSWDASVFTGLSLQDMQLLHEDLQCRCGLRYAFQPLCADVEIMKDDTISIATTATSDDMEKSVVKLRSQSFDQHELESEPEAKLQNIFDLAFRSNGSEDTREERLMDTPVVLKWSVDAKKLRTRDQQIVSPILEIDPKTSCRLMIKPTSKGDKKKQTTFLKSLGCGSIECKLLQSGEARPQLGLGVSVGQGKQAQKLLEVVKHDFDRSSVCRLGEEWNFRSAIDAESATFLVSVELF